MCAGLLESLTDPTMGKLLGQSQPALSQAVANSLGLFQPALQQATGHEFE